jgi:hypothetical protein
MSFKTRVLPYFRHWTKTAVVAAAQTITDIANLWGYWRSDTGVNGKLAVDVGNSESLNLPSSTHFELQPTEQFSWSFWVNDLGSSVGEGVISNENAAAGGYIIGYTSSGLCFYIASSSGNSLFARYSSPSGMTHIVATYDGTATKNVDRWKVYYDGVLQTRLADISGGTLQDTITYNSNFEIFGSTSANLNTPNTSKYVDQIILFKKLLSQSEITTLYNSGNGLKAYDVLNGGYTFTDSCKAENGGAFYDYDSPRNFGRESSQATHAVSITPTSDYFSIADAGAGDFNFDYNDPWTVTSWFRTNGAITNNQSITIASKRDDIASPFEGWFCDLFNNAGTYTLRMRVRDNSSNAIEVNSTTSINDDQWYHVAFTFDGVNASGMNIYLNGVNVTDGSPISDGTLSTITNTNDFSACGSALNSAARESSYFDQLNIYNSSLSASTINSLYNSGAPLNYADLSAAQKTNLVSHWDFNEQDHTIIGQDSHTNLNHLTPTSIAEADLVGGVGSLDLTENGIDSSNAVAGVVVGQVINQENVFSWTDLSGNSNDLEQSTIANQPLFDENKGIRFTGSKFLITSGNAGIATDFTVFMVGQFTDITEATALLKTSADLISKDTSGKIKNDFATTPNASTTALVNNTNKIFAVRLEDGVAGDYWFDGTQGDSITDTTNNTTDAALRLINTTLTGTAFIDSVVVYQRSLTDAEMADVFTDLNNRFSVY